MKRTMTTNSIFETMATRFDVDTVDGARIAVWSVGNGPGLVLVHGSIADHRTFESLISAVAVELTEFAMDRRGFGASPDTSGYSILRDFADVAGVVDAVAAAPAGRSACGATRTGPTARWAARRSPATSTISSCTNPALAFLTRRVPTRPSSPP